MGRIRVLLAEDHETVRQGLKLLLESQPDIEVVGEAADGRTALERTAALKPHVVVMDISMPDMNGLMATRTLKQTVPDVAVVALTRHGDDAYVQELLGAGATGYVLKQSASSELLCAIRSAAAGEKYLDSTLAARAADAYVSRHSKRSTRPVISDRESSVLRLMAVGHSNKEIASELEISVKTVEVHKANAMRKLGLRGRIDVVRFAVLNNWLQDP
jgi:two-component system, NarL family, response regulator NreC